LASDPRNLVTVLQAELEFIERGGYRTSSQCSWKAPLLFLDSPSCLNFNLPQRPHPCGECFLTDFVPVPFLEESVPCHFIPLNEHGETINSLERQAHQTEMEEAVKQWLRATIARLTAASGIPAPTAPSTSRSARP
jgi:hypothetical protein